MSILSKVFLIVMISAFSVGSVASPATLSPEAPIVVVTPQERYYSKIIEFNVRSIINVYRFKGNSGIERFLIHLEKSFKKLKGEEKRIFLLLVKKTGEDPVVKWIMQQHEIWRRNAYKYTYEEEYI